MEIENNKKLKSHNTFNINCYSKYYVSIERENDLFELAKSEVFKNNKRLILGGGSNLLFKNDFDGLVIDINIKGYEYYKIEENVVRVIASAGENWHQFTESNMLAGFYGLENLALIPGKVGAAPIQNIGAYGVEQDDLFDSLTAFSIEDNEFITLKRDDCKFAYRDSIFKNEAKDKFIITSVEYNLNRQFKPVLKYKDLVSHFGSREDISALELFEAICKIRESKLPNPDEIGNSGSFFKNPIISKLKYAELESKYPEMPQFYYDESSVKISAAKLIELCGWKGKSYLNTDAAVYDKHSLILVNKGNARGEDIYNLSAEIIKSVNDKFGVILEREVNLIS